MKGLIIFLICIVFVVTCYFIIKSKNVFKYRGIKKIFKKKIKEKDLNGVLPVIVAGIAAYESSFKVDKRVFKRDFYKRRREEVSLWRIKGRI